MFKNFISNTIKFALVSFMQPAAAFLLLPIYVKYFSVSDFGTFNILNTLINFVGIVGFAPVATSFYYNFVKDPAESKKYKFNLILFSIALNVLMLLVIAIVSYLDFLNPFEVFFGSKKILIQTIAVGFVTNIINLSFVFIRNDQNFNKFLLFSFLNFVLQTISQYIAIVVLNKSLEGAILAKLFSSLFLLTILILTGEIKLAKIDSDYKKLLTPSVSLLFKLIPSTLIMWLNNSSDRYIVKYFLTDKLVGQLAFLITISGLIEMFYLTISQFTLPKVFSLFHDKKTTEIPFLFSLYQGIVLLFSNAIYILVFIFKDYISNKDYIACLNLLPIAIISYLLSSLLHFLYYPLIYHKKSRAMFYTGLVLFFITFVLSIILVPAFGIIGVLCAAIISKIAFTIVLYRVSAHELNLNYTNPIFLSLLLSLLINLLCFSILKFDEKYFIFTIILNVFPTILCFFTIYKMHNQLPKIAENDIQ